MALTGKGVEGETLFFHRVKLAGDTFGGETRLTTGGASPGLPDARSPQLGLDLLDGSSRR